jgi:hypothetical protein
MRHTLDEPTVGCMHDRFENMLANYLEQQKLNKAQPSCLCEIMALQEITDTV